MTPTFWWAVVVGTINGILVWARVKPDEKKKKKERKKDDPSALN